MRAENKLPIVDRSNLIYVINLARRLKQLKDISEAKENENGNGTLIVRKVREELIREILSVIKKVNHGNLNVTIQIRKISEKLLELD